MGRQKELQYCFSALTSKTEVLILAVIFHTKQKDSSRNKNENTMAKQETGFLSPTLVDTKGKQMPDHQSILIFLVDDNELYLRSLEQKFKMNPDLTVKTFLSGEECVNNLSMKPDIIVLDYFLDGKDLGAMDGFKTLVKIKEVSPGTNVIMLSSLESTEVAINCLKYGAFDYIVKNENVFSKLKQTIKKIFSIVSVEKELIIWDW